MFVIKLKHIFLSTSLESLFMTDERIDIEKMFKEITIARIICSFGIYANRIDVLIIQRFVVTAIFFYLTIAR